MGGFTFNGIHSKVMGVKAIKTVGRPFITPKKHRFIDIPYRDGSYLIADDSKPDIFIKITMLFELPQSAYAIARSMDTWLSHSMWKQLKFDDDPNYFYYAILVEADPIGEEKKVKEYTVQFRCNPNQNEVS